MVDPPVSHKYVYWSNTALPPNSVAWFEGAESHEGSLWLDWKKWVSRYNGKKVPARAPGEGGLAAIEDAPGSYVQVRV